VPDNVLPEIPTISLEGERYAPRDADQVFRFQPGFGLCMSGHVVIARLLWPLFRIASSVPTMGITITKINKNGSIIPQYPTNGPEHINHLGNVFI
jgi:hypothetical protein